MKLFLKKSLILCYEENSYSIIIIYIRILTGAIVVTQYYFKHYFYLQIVIIANILRSV